ncbi:ABC transporter ATP-binding protein [Tenacibaculum maritimum]|uniref:ABC transporter ATP-binding protein n=1 Tax=Tenacibaculum maritimum TaxID=107401 RepID=UPI001E5CCB8C|nr:ABC transporter ATP-binding protein [Tenacibaculum maritimum]MCD9563347.1 ABC transporter ATP-binding protein/permease [Tenacibaculum maritimum]MCD9566242.1 ABC transporter ATP-binding protein/permease [Tenacibaculum maritimum]MCD9578730.1 ABC transporter ATP-binding protein/permease [Tenacibaculum maritimum]MCD9596831.1 ABC transporter ATP-binding protein/permease [Tenacibaculum maritimum]MCD9613985.1 ABC transporter ATP-binding protein/permease [Tenacibaculum maritimum]
MNNQKGKVKVSIGKAFKTIIWPKRNLVFIGLILIVLSRLSSLVLPWKSKQLLDEVIPNKDYQQLYKLLIIVGSAMLIQAITSFLLTKILSIQAQYLISELRAQVQKKVLSLPIHFFDDTKSGALVSRIMSDVEGVRNLIGTGLVQLLGGTITAVVAMTLLIRISLSMTFFVLIPVTIFGIVALKAFKYIRPIFRKRGVINAQVKGRLTETLAGVRVIKAFNAETQEHQSFEKGVYLLFENVKKSLTATAFMTSASTFLLGIASTGIMGIGGYKIMEGELSIGDFLSFTLLLGFMIAPIVQMSNIGSQLTEALAGLDRTEELMNMQGEEEDVKRTISLETVKGNLVFDKVSFAYEEGKNVLEDISFIVPEGSVTALVGSSGSGKSTIAGLVATFLNPTRGLITIGGKDLSKVRLNSYRKHLGVVLQDEFLFEGTIRENVLFARPNATEEELQSAVSAAYVDEFTDRFENGLDTLIGERGVKLSGGQRQRLAIARAILADPEIIILDEATSSLDTESEALIQKSLSKLIKNRTTIVIAHRLSTIKQADQILVIESGSIVERGTHKKLIEVAGRYYDLYTYQAKI